MTKQILRTQVQNMEKKKLLSDVEMRETMGVGRAEDDIEKLNEESYEIVVIYTWQLNKKKIALMLQRKMCVSRKMCCLLATKKSWAIER